MPQKNTVSHKTGFNQLKSDKLSLHIKNIHTEIFWGKVVKW